MWSCKVLEEAIGEQPDGGVSLPQERGSSVLMSGAAEGGCTLMPSQGMVSKDRITVNLDIESTGFCDSQIEAASIVQNRMRAPTGQWQNTFCEVGTNDGLVNIRLPTSGCFFW